MTARYFEIVSKPRDNPLAFVQPVDFVLRPGPEVDPRLVVDHRHLSLYCLDPDERRVLFVETAPDADLYTAPFLYQAQFEAARRVIGVSYETLHDLAASVRVAPSRLSLIYSVGRCGSTLVSRAFQAADRVVSFAEPDVYSQILSLRAEDGSNAAEEADLVRSCTRILCHHAAATTGGDRWVMKLRGFCTELADVFAAELPDANVLFLYRRAETWLPSAGRAFGFLEPEALEHMAEIQAFFAQMSPRIRAFGRKRDRTITGVELLACMWLSVMDRGIALQQARRPVFAVRYEDLRRSPRAVIEAMFGFCGVEVGDSAALDAILARDSQEGSAVSRDAVEAVPVTVSPEQIRELVAFLRIEAPDIPPDIVLPGSYVPVG